MGGGGGLLGGGEVGEGVGVGRGVRLVRQSIPSNMLARQSTPSLKCIQEPSVFWLIRR